jgi:hypothetical protein
MRIKVILGAAFISALTLQNCSRMDITGTASGGESKTARISGSVMRPGGTPAANVPVRLRKSDYVSPAPGSLAKATIYGADALTDAHGGFQISGIDSGSYSIEVNDSSSAVLFTCTIGAHDTSSFRADTLRPYAWVSGTIDTTGMSGKRLYVQVLGLERLAPVGSTGAFEFKDLPAGLFSLHIVSVAGTQTTLIQSDQVSAISGDTVSVFMPGWSYSAKLYINTTASGAGVFGNVTNFPVLIRLTSGNFTFAQAKPNGDDVRFTKSNGTPLSYEIERWDASLGAAEIWVKLDTVFGNDSSHFVTMYWGNPNATSASSSTTVFDTANGFQGVWHLDETSGSMAKDATRNKFDGSPSASAPAAIPGLIGTAQSFDGVSNLFEMKGTASGRLNFSDKDTFAISAWVNTEAAVDSVYYKILAKGVYQYHLQINGSRMWEFSNFVDHVAGWETVQQPVTTLQWVHLAGIYAGGSEYLYVNGICVDSVIKVVPNLGQRDTTYNVTIGAIANGSRDFFKGIMDEARVGNRAWSADWIKLCYMNQKGTDALVVIDKMR